MHAIAIYDLDKTITYAPTWTSFLVSSAKRQKPWRLALLPLAGAMTLGYVLKLVDRAGLKQATQRLMLGDGWQEAAAARAAAAFADDVVARGVYGEARAQIAADRAAGRRIVLATASYAFYAGAIAERLGFDDVIGTGVVREEGRLRARIDGENCYGAAKLRMIEAWMAREGIARGETQIRFYSDHVSDAPTLAWADEAFAVNPHGPLRALAAERGWTVVDWVR
jgi:HAD superfamily hydrolase (TIGR01490 family)